MWPISSNWSLGAHTVILCIYWSLRCVLYNEKNFGVSIMYLQFFKAWLNYHHSSSYQIKYIYLQCVMSTWVLSQTEQYGQNPSLFPLWFFYFMRSPYPFCLLCNVLRGSCYGARTLNILYSRDASWSSLISTENRCQ